MSKEDIDVLWVQFNKEVHLNGLTDEEFNKISAGALEDWFSEWLEGVR